MTTIAQRIQNHVEDKGSASIEGAGTFRTDGFTDESQEIFTSYDERSIEHWVAAYNISADDLEYEGIA